MRRARQGEIDSRTGQHAQPSEGQHDDEHIHVVIEALAVAPDLMSGYGQRQCDHEALRGRPQAQMAQVNQADSLEEDGQGKKQVNGMANTMAHDEPA